VNGSSGFFDSKSLLPDKEEPNTQTYETYSHWAWYVTVL